MAYLHRSWIIFLCQEKPPKLSNSTKITVKFGKETICYTGSPLWNIILDDIKPEPTLNPVYVKYLKPINSI